MNDTHHANYQVETSLGDVARALWRRKWILLLVVPLFLIGTYFYTQRLPKQWQAEGQMLIVQRAGAAPVGPQGYIPPATESVSTQIGMLRTAAMADRALSWLKNKELRDGQPLDTEGIGIGTLQNAVNVSSPADSDLINLSVLGTSRDQAILLTNAVAQSFVQWKQEEARKDIQKTERTLAAQNATAKKRLDAARLRQLTYQKGHSILDPVAQAENGVQQERERKNAVDQITEERDSEQTNVNFLKNQVDAANVSIQKVGVRNDELTAKLQSQLSDLKIQRKALARVVTPAYPGKLPDIDQLIANVQQELNTAVKATQSGTSSTLPAQATMVQQYHQAQDQLAATESRLTDAVAQEDAATKAILPLVVTSSTYEQVARQAQDASRSYNDLQAALQSAKLLESHINGDIQITQQAVAPDRPAKPSLPLNMLMGGLLGLLTALGAIFVIEQLDRRVRTERNSDQWRPRKRRRW